MTNTEINTVHVATILNANLAPAVNGRFPKRRHPSVRQHLDEIHVDGRDDQEADLIIEDDGRIGVRAVVRVMLPEGSNAGDVIAVLATLGVL
ncbi:MAG: hypothetical protein M0R37_14695 [Bacteroidales bacterium]|jgi:hypothetical protein|nr:hypothetical protein [Bacteroidales bacterium]